MKTFYSPHRQKTQRNKIPKNRLKYDETIQYNILQYSKKYKKYKYIYFVIAIL